MILTAHQPSYMPWLGLFEKISRSDVYCVFNEVQYTSKDFINRNRIKTNSGVQWLTVPVLAKGHRARKISEIEILQNGWAIKQLKTIKMAYARAPFIEKYIDKIEEIFLFTQWSSLQELNYEWLKFGLHFFKLNPEIVFASDFHFKGAKSDLVLDMCKTLGADRYIFGAHGVEYANIESFSKNEIEVEFQDFLHPTYNQIHGEFVSHLSFIDYMLNVGPSGRDIFKQSQMKGNNAKIEIQ